MANKRRRREPAEGHQYRIGALVRMTGVPAVTIRMWERRHAALDPERTSKNGRLYGLAHVKRLTMLRRLTEAGHAISTVAPLSDAQLAERLGGVPVPVAERTARLALVGPQLARFARTWDADSQFPVATSVATPEQALAGKSEPAEVVVVEIDVLGPDTAARVDALARHFSARQSVVVYQFASRKTLDLLERAQVLTLQAPVSARELKRILPALRASVVEAITAESKTGLPARRFSGEELAALSEHPEIVHCECPRHLVDLITKLSAFERYSAQCESQHADDAAVHEQLHRITAQARRIMEDGLALILLQEKGRPGVAPA